MRCGGKRASQVKAYQIMTKDVVSVSPGQTVSEAARLMGKGADPAAAGA